MNSLRSLFVFVVGLFSLLYLTNPSAGFIELIPDNFPVIGNLDEAAATTMLIAALAYFGIDVTKLFQARREEKEESKVVDVETEKHVSS